VRILHVGCGRKKLGAADLLASVGLSMPSEDIASTTVVHLDAAAHLEPDILCELGFHAIPLEDNSIDVVIAWHVLEHIGKQGESAAWFRAFEELYRVLKPSGWLYGECPYYTSIWAWSDPTHTRAISEHSFIFFAQDSYRIPGSMISPYRIATDFVPMGIAGMERGWAVLPDARDPKSASIRFALAARKPLTPWWEDARTLGTELVSQEH
jgi:SAM-dependent methyltransferase